MSFCLFRILLLEVPTGFRYILVLFNQIYEKFSADMLGKKLCFLILCATLL